MTNLEALQAQFNFPLKKQSLELCLLNQGLQPDVEYTLEAKKAIDLAIAELILIAVTSPKSVSDLDYSMTKEDTKELINLRSLILKRYAIKDELTYTGAVIQDATHFWGSTSYD